MDEVLDHFPRAPRVFILRLRLVPLIDASGATALRQLVKRCKQSGIRVILSGLREQPREVLRQMNLIADGTHLQFAEDFGEALRLASAQTMAPELSDGGDASPR